MLLRVPATKLPYKLGSLHYDDISIENGPWDCREWSTAPWTDSALLKKYHVFRNTQVVVHTWCIHHLKSGRSSHLYRRYILEAVNPMSMLEPFVHIS